MSENNGSPIGKFIFFSCLILGGFVFPYLFLIAGVMAIVMFNEWNSPQIKSVPPTPPRRLTVTAADADWKEEFLDFCESPAETAFLEAAVTEYGLVPTNGKLKGSGLSLELQFVTAPYRVDFLVDGWLVVEIDGAAYHSSAEAVEKDAARDEVLRSRGFTVLRIPAKIVFSSSAEAVRRVGVARSEGPKKPDQQTADIALQEVTHQRVASRKLDYRKVMGELGNSISGVDKFVSKASAERKALADIKAAHDAEKSVILAALDRANYSLELDIYKPMDLVEEQSFAANYRRSTYVRGAFVRLTTAPSTVERFSDDEIDQHVQLAHHGCLRLRSGFLDKIRSQLDSNAALADHVKSNLLERNYGEVWETLKSHSADI